MSCTYYEYKGGLFSGDYWCKKKDCRVDDQTYYRYCRNYSYDECPIYKESQSSGCFITTIACQVLKKDDSDPVLNNLRKFRNEILQKNQQYYDVLKEYDVIGPMIADCIIQDKDREQMALGLYQNAILPISKLISENHYEKAVEMYYIMTLSLVNYYGLKHEYNDLKSKDYNYGEFNPTTAGHGRKRIKMIQV